MAGRKAELTTPATILDLETASFFFAIDIITRRMHQANLSSLMMACNSIDSNLSGIIEQICMETDNGSLLGIQNNANYDDGEDLVVVAVEDSFDPATDATPAAGNGHSTLALDVPDDDTPIDEDDGGTNVDPANTNLSEGNAVTIQTVEQVKQEEEFHHHSKHDSKAWDSKADTHNYTAIKMFENVTDDDHGDVDNDDSN
eukprot:jgi/Psemu1/28367/gm1.28367_g